MLSKADKKPFGNSFLRLCTNLQYLLQDMYGFGRLIHFIKTEYLPLELFKTILVLFD